MRDEEREFVKKMIRQLDLSAEEAKQVHGWLEVPPAADTVEQLDAVPRLECRDSGARC